MARPPKYDETMTRKSITVTQAQAAWMDAQQNASEIIRNSIERMMTMDAQAALEIMQDKRDGDRYMAANVIAAEMEHHGVTGSSDSLTEWVYSGDYDGTETIDSMIAEWNE